MRKIDLTTGSISKKIIIVALPLLLSNLIGMLYNFTDMYWISKYDQEAVSAIGIGGLFLWFGSGLGLIATLGTKVFVASNVSKKNTDEAILVGRDGLKIGIIVGVLYAITLLICHTLFVSLFNYESVSVNNYANTYLSIIAFMIPLLIINEVFASIANGFGNSRVVFIISLISVGLNIILDPLLIQGFDLGIAGAAYATVISAVVATIIWCIYLAKKTHIFEKGFLKYHKYIKKIFRFGFIPSLLGILFPLINMFITKKAIEFGDDYGGVIRVGAQIESFAWAVGIGITTAVTIFFAQNFAVKQFKRMAKGIKFVNTFILIYGFVLMLVFIFKGDAIFSIFYKGNATVIEYGSVYLFFLAFSLHAMLFEGVYTGALNGLEKSTLPATISFIGNVIRIPLVIILGVIFGIKGIWLTYVISSTLKAISVYICYKIIYHKKVEMQKIEMT